MSASDTLAAISQWIDDGQCDRDPEAITWGRLAKVAEECGEVIAAFIGVTGQNPRKGVTHTRDDVADELLDVAITALCAFEHLTGNRGESMSALISKILTVHKRAVS